MILKYALWLMVGTEQVNELSKSVARDNGVCSSTIVLLPTLNQQSVAVRKKGYK